MSKLNEVFFKTRKTHKENYKRPKLTFKRVFKNIIITIVGITLYNLLMRGLTKKNKEENLIESYTYEMVSEKDNIKCEIHGNQGYGLVCQHLNSNEENNGFWEPFDSEFDKEYEDGELNGWCNKCDEVLMKEGEWNENSESFAQIKLVCKSCYFEIKKKNKLNLDNNG